MANKYVDARNGNDSNDGSDWANAKKTIQAMYTAANAGDVIYCAGVFNESLSFGTAAKHMYLVGVGAAVLDGLGALGWGFYSTAINNASYSITDFTIKNYQYGVGSVMNAGNDGQAMTLVRCVIEDCSVAGVYCGGARHFARIVNTVIRNCPIGVYSTNAAQSCVPVLQNCTITGCATYGYYNQTPSTANTQPYATRSIFYNNGYHIYISASCGLTSAHNQNCIDFSSGKCYWPSADKTTMADWRTASSRDASSLDADPLFLDADKNLHRLQKTTPAIIGGVILGAFSTLLAEGCSHNYEEPTWSGATVAPEGSCYLDANDNWVLSGTVSSGTVTFEYDFGSAPRSIRRINLSHSYAGVGGGVGGGPTGLLDYDMADTLPETWEYRVAVDTGSGYGAFAEKKLYDDIALSGVIKIKIEVTLRSDG